MLSPPALLLPLCGPQLYPPPPDVDLLTGEVRPAGFTALNGTNGTIGVFRWVR